MTHRTETALALFGCCISLCLSGACKQKAALKSVSPGTPSGSVSKDVGWASGDRDPSPSVETFRRWAQNEASANLTTQTLAAIDRVKLSEIPGLLSSLPQSALRDAMTLRLAFDALHRGQVRMARTHRRQVKMARTHRRATGGGLSEALVRFDASLSKHAQGRGARVAFLLPASGSHRLLGLEAQAAMQIAFPKKHFQVQTFDTRGQAEGAKEAVEQASAWGAQVALGPMGYSTSEAAATAALKLGLPLALMSPTYNQSVPSDGVFNFFPSVEWEAKQAAYAALQLGFSAPAVLAPRDLVGMRQAKAFASALSEKGVSDTPVGYYDPDSKDLEQDLRQFFGLTQGQNARLRAHIRRWGRGSRKTFTPDLSIDLLYIPDQVSRGALVASYLPFFNIVLRHSEDMNQYALKRRYGGHVPSVLQLLGSFAWHDPQLWIRGGDSVSGALVPSICPSSKVPEMGTPWADFRSRFAKRTGREPTPLAMQFYDGAQLVRSAWPEGEVSRARLSKKLAKARLGDGVCGPAKVDNGRIVREIVLERSVGDDFTWVTW